jgi:orotidine 5'-phosphate decarboxylase subfamily 1
MDYLQQRIQQTYTERAEGATNEVATKLLKLMDEKQTNLSLLNDVTNSEKFLELADACGPEIAILKTHIDIIKNFTPKLIEELQSLAKQYNFIIFEDRKFADIGNTVKMQYGQGIYQIAKWADLTNAHIVPGPGVIEGLKAVADEQTEPRGLILLAQMSSEGNLATDEYTQQAVAMAESFLGFVVGFIGNGGNPDELKKLTSIVHPRFVILTPGVKLGGGGDKLKQTYSNPQEAVNAGSDVILVGRGIYAADNPKQSAQEHRKAGWEAYQNRISSARG